MPMPSNSFVLNSCWCYPVVQHLTASAEGGGKDILSIPGEKKVIILYYVATVS